MKQSTQTEKTVKEIQQMNAEDEARQKSLLALSAAERIQPVTDSGKVPSVQHEALMRILATPESERQILRCAPPFDAQAEHEADLAYESRVDAESWQYDGPAEREDY